MAVENHESFKLTLSYDGTAYLGWQSQPGGNTIQQRLQRAIAKVTHQRAVVTGSGRTDSGVHALGQVASFSATTRMSCRDMQNAINANLPQDIRVLELQTVDPSFCAQRSATRKRYLYLLQDGEHPDVIRRRYCWFVRGELAVEAIQRAASHLLGTHDFASFQAAGSARASTRRQVMQLSVERRSNPSWGTAPSHIAIEICANGFLYRMVRNIVGTLVDVGLHKRTPDSVAEVLAVCDRNAAGRTAPPHGLYLLEVRYD